MLLQIYFTRTIKIDTFGQFFANFFKRHNYDPIATHYSFAKSISLPLKAESRCLITNTENLSSIRLRQPLTNLTHLLPVLSFSIP